MHIKNQARLRRAKTTRARISKQGVARLSVHRTGKHLYAQVFAAGENRVLAAANTLQDEVAKELVGTKNLAAAAAVGRAIAERALAAGVDKVAFDRSGFLYHGRIKALADAARAAGLQF